MRPLDTVEKILLILWMFKAILETYIEENMF